MLLAYRSAHYCAAFLITVVLCATNANAAWQTPLTEQDVASLSARAIAQYRISNRSSADLKTGFTLDVEVLMVELQEKKSREPNAPRLAEVFIYDYSTNRASRQLIDTVSHELVSTHPITNIHLPLNQRERALAVQILLSNDDLLSELTNEYVEQFGQPLATLAQLDMKVSIWEPGVSDIDTGNCKQTRCALVSVFTQEHYNFSVEPVVELQNAIVYLDLVQ